MPQRPSVLTKALRVALVSLALHAAAQAQSPQPTPAEASRALHLRALAATCNACHGTDGHAQRDESLPSLAGQSKDYMLQQLLAFRGGQRPATVMHQLTRGYTPAQLEAIAGYFAQVSPQK